MPLLLLGRGCKNMEKKSLSDICQRAGHRFYVADVVGVESEGTATIIVLCTSCGESFSRVFKVSEGNKPLRLKSTENKE